MLKTDWGIGVCLFYDLVAENDDVNETTEQESSFQANAQSYKNSGLYYLIKAIMAFISTSCSMLFWLNSLTDDEHSNNFLIVEILFTNLNIIVKNQFAKDFSKLVRRRMSLIRNRKRPILPSDINVCNSRYVPVTLLFTQQGEGMIERKMQLPFLKEL